jgi:hypothetical protein
MFLDSNQKFPLTSSTAYITIPRKVQRTIRSALYGRRKDRFTRNEAKMNEEGRIKIHPSPHLSFLFSYNTLENSTSKYTFLLSL